MSTNSPDSINPVRRTIPDSIRVTGPAANGKTQAVITPVRRNSDGSFASTTVTFRELNDNSTEVLSSDGKVIAEIKESSGMLSWDGHIKIKGGGDWKLLQTCTFSDDEVDYDDLDFYNGRVKTNEQVDYLKNQFNGKTVRVYTDPENKRMFVRVADQKNNADPTNWRNRDSGLIPIEEWIVDEYNRCNEE